MMFEGENEDDSFGDQSGVFGDVNNDGYLDALVGASALSSESSKGEAYNGKAILYFGPFATEDLQDKMGARGVRPGGHVGSDLEIVFKVISP